MHSHARHSGYNRSSYPYEIPSLQPSEPPKAPKIPRYLRQPPFYFLVSIHLYFLFPPLYIPAAPLRDKIKPKSLSREDINAEARENMDLLAEMRWASFISRRPPVGDSTWHMTRRAGKLRRFVFAFFFRLRLALPNHPLRWMFYGPSMHEGMHNTTWWRYMHADRRVARKFLFITLPYLSSILLSFFLSFVRFYFASRGYTYERNRRPALQTQWRCRLIFIHMRYFTLL